MSFRHPVAVTVAAVLGLAAGQAASASAPAAVQLSPSDAAAIRQALAQAEDEGLPPFSAESDDQLPSAAIAYAAAEHGQRLARTAFPKFWAIRPARYDAAADFAAAVAEHRVAAWLKGLPPPDPRYAQLVAAYARYRQIASAGGWPLVPSGPSLKPGATGPRVAALRARLAVEDAAAAPAAGADPASFDPALSQALALEQERLGLSADGVAGPATLRALNVTAGQRLGQIRANLERWRWVPRALPPMRIELNTAAQALSLYDGGSPVLVMRAIVGKPKTPTPMFEDRARSILFNPPWNVPDKIARNEIWPKIRRNPGYMAREGFVVKPDGRLQQRPGPKCALGTVKFELGNAFDVYLHDTPARTLFAKDERALSHGCMRLEQPHALAERLLKDSPEWPAWRIQGVVASGDTIRAPLARPVPVYVFYWTVFVGDDGQVNFRPDIYRWDEALLGML